ncbi:Phosphatidylinositol glycan anchor biosynthesis class U protein [Ceratocystis lukuohia]|uniref:Phosphatidylinositol glycan anchor biosynthesis class U protein n=1 Tax=Ceratocystis lukuohia TaxID=2019550 RepID=A0ABR4MP01_9PEZI
MSSKPQQTTTVYAAAAAVRLFLIVLFPTLPQLLTSRVEISTPITSFKRLQEGLFLFNHNVSPYDGGVFHQAPLLLPLFGLLPSNQAWPIFTYLLYIAVDLLSAGALRRIADSGEAGSSKLFTSPRRERKWSGSLIAAFYLFNPFTVATCLGRSTGVFTTCATLHAVANAIEGAPVLSMIALTFASYLSMYPVLLAPPLLMLSYDRQVASRRVESPVKFAVICAAVFIATSTFLLSISYFITDCSWDFLGSTYGIQLTLSDLTPNVGLWWYFFIEMFDPFRNFFLAVFWLHLSSYVPGLSIRMRSQPLIVITLLLGVFSIFKPYASVADTSLFLSLVPMFRHIFPLMRYSFVTAAVIMYATFLGPVFYHLWIYAGSGNANFFYAITLVWGLGQSLVVSDLAFASLRDEWEVSRPEMLGKEIQLI